MNDPTWVSEEIILPRPCILLTTMDGAGLTGIAMTHVYSDVKRVQWFQTFYEDLEQGHDSEWTFFVDYDVVRVIHFDWVVLQWI